MKQRKVTLRYVFYKALKDRRFCNALINRPKKTLASRGFVLSDRELAALLRYLRKKHCFTGRKLLKVLSEITPPSPKPWPI